MSEKAIVLYHANCSDGFGAAFAAWLKLGDTAEYIPANYGDINTPQSVAEFFDCSIAERTVYILDFSFPRQVMDWLFAHAGRVVWADHHRSAFEMWCEDGELNRCEQSNGRDYVLLDNNKSGALLAWEYFHPHVEAPRAIKHIDDRDRWQFKMGGTKEFSAALFSYQPWTFEQWVGLGCGDRDGAFGLYAEGEGILRAHNSNVQATLPLARKCRIVPGVIRSIDSYSPPWTWRNDAVHGDTCEAIGLAVNCPAHLSSDVGHELANKSGTFGLCWSLDAENVVRCSLRSNGDYDVSAIAKQYGGGGHKNAAGFSTNIGTLMGWLK